MLAHILANEEPRNAVGVFDVTDILGLRKIGSALLAIRTAATFESGADWGGRCRSGTTRNVEVENCEALWRAVGSTADSLPRPWEEFFETAR